MGSLPREESLRARVLSAHGVAVAWLTLGAEGERATHDGEEASAPTFYLRRPHGAAAHLWRLFRTKRDAVAFMKTHFADDPEARQWAMDLPADDFRAVVDRAATGEQAPGAPA
jgi:hypothetical protein